MAETSIARAARISRENKAKREAAEKAAAEKPAKTPEKEGSSSLIDKIRKAFGSEDDIKRIDEAVDAVSQGVKQADKDSKRRKA